MSELPVDEVHQVIHLGDRAAVIVPLEEYRLLRQAAEEHRIDEEFQSALRDTEARRQEGTLEYVSSTEARRRLGLPAQ
jgi:PHD/YefM family antitoxin component YafN of YafNO toxin-antitoxin module